VADSALANAFYAKGKVVLVEPLGTRIRRGSIGYFSDGQWVEVSTTQKMFGISLPPEPGSGDNNTFDGKSGKGFSFTTKAKGELSDLVPNIADAKARAEISFGSKDGFVMNVRNQTVETTRDLAELMAAIRWAYHYRTALPEGRRWDKKYAVIVGVASADSITAVSSTSANAAIVVEAAGRLPAPSSPADLDASMKITRTKESTEKLWRGPATGYAVQALRLDPSIWKRWRNEELKYLSRAERAAAAKKAPPRPASYTQWAAQYRRFTNPETAKVQMLSTSGRARATGTAASLTKALAKKAPAKKRTTAR
jgi:hypothetical protein